MKENEELQTLLLTKQVKEGQNLLAGQQKNITRETEDMNNEQVRSNRNIKSESKQNCLLCKHFKNAKFY